MQYDGEDGDYVVLDVDGLGGLDVSNGGWGQSISFHLVALDTATTFSLELYSNETHWSKYSLRLEPTALDLLGVLPLAIFDHPGTGGGVDVSNLGAMS